MNRFWDWLKDSGTQAMFVLLGTIFAFAAAFAAIYYGKKSLTKKDLEPLEQNTADTSGHLENVHTRLTSLDESTRRQEDVGSLERKAAFVSITARGVADAGQPLSVYLIGKEPDPRLTRVEFRNEQGNAFGQSACTPTDNLFEFVAQLSSDQLIRWREGGIQVSVGAKRNTLRVWMLFDEHPDRQVHRDMAVILITGLRGGGKDAPGINVTTFSIEGTV